MTVASVRTRPLIAVISRVPLFVEALRGSFEGIADVQSVSADDVAAEGLVRAFHPNWMLRIWRCPASASSCRASA